MALALVGTAGDSSTLNGPQGVLVDGDTVLVTTSTPNIRVVDVSDRTSPSLGATVTFINGERFAKKGRAGYVAGARNAGAQGGPRLAKFDLDLLPTVTLSEGTHTDTTTNRVGQAVAVLPDDDIAVTADGRTTATSDDFVTVWDVSGTPTYQADDADTAYADLTDQQSIVANSGGIVYAINHGASVSSTISVIDVSDPLNPTRLGGVGQGGTQIGRALAIDVANERLYTSNKSGTNPGIRVYDLATPTSPSFLAADATGSDANPARDMKIHNGHLFVVFAGSLRVYRIDASAVTHLEAITTGLSTATALDVDERYVYLVDVANHQLRIYSHDYGRGWTVGSIAF